MGKRVYTGRTMIKDKAISEVNALLIGNASLNLEFFGYFNLHIDYIKSEDYSTFAIGFNDNGKIVCYYNPEFLKELNTGQLIFVLIHEACHILNSHITRVYSVDLDLWNFATDMVINKTIFDRIIFNSCPTEVIIEGGIIEMPPFVLLPPKSYNGHAIAEDMYSFLLDAESDFLYNTPNPALDETISNSNVTLRELFENKKLIAQLVDEYLENKLIPESVRYEIARNIVNGIRNRGYVTQSVEQFLCDLQPSTTNYLKQIRESVAGLTFTRTRRSYMRSNRREIEGIKGKIKYGSFINIILDVSGSMKDQFEKVLSAIYQSEIEMRLIQCDTEIKKIIVIRSKMELQRMAITGLGGTNLQPAINYMIEREPEKNCGLIILTDGKSNTLDFTSFKKQILIITSSDICTYIGSNKVRIIKL